MRVVENQITDYRTALNFTEDETLWTSGATFNYRDEIRWGHYIYTYASQEANTNTTVNPEEDVSLNSSDYTNRWVETRPSNYYAMLDGKTSTQTENADTIEFELTNDNYDSFALLGLEAFEVTIELVDIATTTVLDTYVYDLQDQGDVVDEYSYWFYPLIFRDNVYTQDIPLVSNTKLVVTIDNTGGTAKCGRIVYGYSYYIGETAYPASLDLESYSRDDTDIFGNTTLVQVSSVNRDSYQVKFATDKIPTLKKKRQQLDAVAVLFVADESQTSNTENLLNFGYWKRFKISLKYPTRSYADIEIKGIL